MQFKSDGTLKIMQITDMQEIPAISPDTLALLDAAVEAEHPDLVIYTGDQIKGYGVTYKGKTKKELEAAVAKTITALLEPVTRRHIPFAVTFGNHDRQVGISNADQFNHIYKSLPGCIGEQAEGIPGGGTYAVPLTASDGSGRTVMNLYLFDTGTDAKGGGYEAFDPAIIDWYRKTRDALKAETGHYVPSLVFQHIPMPEYYHVLRRVKKSEKGAIQAFRTHKNEFYKLGDTCRPGDMLEEPPSIPDINNGEYDALHEKGDILGVFVGHDHKNSFVGRYKDMDLGFTQSAGIIQVLTFTLLSEVVIKLPAIQSAMESNATFARIMQNEYGPMYLTALILSVVWNFTFNRKFTFKSAANVPVAMLKVFAFYLVFTPISTLLGNYFTAKFADVSAINYIVLGLTMATNMITEFLYDKFVVFRGQENTAISKKDKKKA